MEPGNLKSKMERVGPGIKGKKAGTRSSFCAYADFMLFSPYFF